MSSCPETTFLSSFTELILTFLSNVFNISFERFVTVLGKMEYTYYGNSGLRISKLGLGLGKISNTDLENATKILLGNISMEC